MPIPFPGEFPTLKRDSYDDEILFFCEDCREEFTAEGVVEYIGNGEERVIPASEPILCPNDPRWIRLAGPDRRIIPIHDVSYYPGGAG